MPGDIKTDFTSGRKKNEKGSEIYKSMKRSVAVMEKDEENGDAQLLLKTMLNGLSDIEKEYGLYISMNEEVR